MNGIASMLAAGIKRLIVGLLAITGIAALLAVAVLASQGALTRKKLQAMVEVLRHPDEAPAAAPAPAKPEAERRIDEAMTLVGSQIEAERLGLRGLQESMRRLSDDMQGERIQLNKEKDEFTYQKNRPEFQGLLKGGRPAAGGAPTAAPAPIAGGGGAPASSEPPEAAFAQAVRVAAKTDPRALARTLLTWTAAEPAPAGQTAPRVVPHYAEMLRYLRALRDSQAAEVLEEMAGLRGPGAGDDPEYGKKVSAELQLRMGRTP